MIKHLKKFWHWLRMEDADGKPIDGRGLIVGVNDLRYSECIKKFPLKEPMTPDDILHISHKKADGQWQTCYIMLKQLKEGLA
jgi:hypothetical protein